MLVTWTAGATRTGPRTSRPREQVSGTGSSTVWDQSKQPTLVPAPLVPPGHALLPCCSQRRQRPDFSLPAEKACGTRRSKPMSSCPLTLPRAAAGYGAATYDDMLRSVRRTPADLHAFVELHIEQVGCCYHFVNSHFFKI